jgi:predicted CXXCH cytochrome family protein
MTFRSILPVVALALVLSAAPGRALDAPHDASASPPTTCTLCHVPHSAPGGTLTSAYGNPNLCFSCHNLPNVGTRLGFPWTAADEAVPGAGGRSHPWDALVTSSGHGARPPLNAEMAKRIDSGRLTCSVCHDQHGTALQYARGAAQHVFTADGKLAIGSTLTRTAGGGTGTLGLTSVAGPTASRSGARPRAYLIRIASGGSAGSATYAVSWDNGRTWSTPAATTSPVALDTDEGGAAVTVSFAGSFNAGDQWKQFTVAYPFLRASNLNSAMCEDCHRDRVQSAACVEGSAGATTGAGDSCATTAGIAYSHPSGVGVMLQQTYDRVAGGVPQPLDVNGATQGGSGGDPLGTNKLVFDAANQVRCLTCHAAHNADSNSLSEDPR